MTVLLIIKITVLLLICTVAIITDLKYRKVFNWLTFPAMGLGLIINVIEHGFPGIGISLIGLLIGGLLFFGAFVFGGMGAGDIKLMAVVGSFMGWLFVLNAAFYTAFTGGIIAIIYLVVQGKMVHTFLNIFRFLRSLIIPKFVVEPLSQENPFPYAMAIGIGTVCTVWLPSLI